MANVINSPYLLVGNSTLARLVNLVELELGLENSGFCFTSRDFDTESISKDSIYLSESVPDTYSYFPTVGDNNTRLSIVDLVSGKEANSLISPRSSVAKDAKIESMCLVMSNVFIGNNVVVNKSTIILPGVVITHDIEIGAGCFISPNAVLSGNVKIGNSVKIGSGAVVPPNSFVPEGTIIGPNEVFSA